MEICNSMHEKICYESSECPLCKERKEWAKTMDEIVNKTTEARQSLPVN